MLLMTLLIFTALFPFIHYFDDLFNDYIIYRKNTLVRS